MNANPNTASAKIYQFAARSRSAGHSPGNGAQVIALRSAAPNLAYCPEVSYHEAAIAADARARKA